MKCHQCGKPALAVLESNEGKVFLCLDHHKMLADIQNVEWLKASAMMNVSLDEMDATVGSIGPTVGRIPVDKIAMAMTKGTIMTNISISNSQLGVLNTGSIEKIDAAITLTKGSDYQIFGQELQKFIQMVLDEGSLSDDEKSEVLEISETIGQQVVVGPGQKSVLVPLINDLKARVGGVLALVNSVDGLKAVIFDLLGIPPD